MVSQSTAHCRTSSGSAEAVRLRAEEEPLDPAAVASPVAPLGCRCSVASRVEIRVSTGSDSRECTLQGRGRERGLMAPKQHAHLEGG